MLRSQQLLGLASQAREIACLTQTRETRLALLEIAENYERQAKAIAATTASKNVTRP